LLHFSRCNKSYYNILWHFCQGLKKFFVVIL